MKIVAANSRFQIYSDDLKTYDKLPTAIYDVSFDKLSGFFLKQQPDIVIEERVYGEHLQKIKKVMDAFALSNRNFGVILSGAKGIGKSLFAKLLAIEMNKIGYPVILVKSYLHGIADFLASINQERMVLFDEFDKTYVDTSREESDSSTPQNQLLTLFDGVDGGNKLFVITCNKIDRLSEYFINRPGRFHYHFRFNYPSKEEFIEYLKNNVREEYWGEIEKVADFTCKVNTNYDCLRAIAFELNSGLAFKEAIGDLNILNIEPEKYSATVVFGDGTVEVVRDLSFDMFSDEDTKFYLRDRGGEYYHISFYPATATYDISKSGYIIDGSGIRIGHDSDDNPKLETIKIKELIIKHERDTNIHYAF